MTEEYMIGRVLEDIRNSEMILIGMGEEMSSSMKVDYEDNTRLSVMVQDIEETDSVIYIDMLDKLAQLLENKNYFIVSTDKNIPLKSCEINPKRILGMFDSEPDEDTEKQWDFYNKWLSVTLNRKLVILELGEGFLRPNLIRWPFEKITYINHKASMYRVNLKFPQIPENIKEKAFPVKENALEFLKKVVHHQTNIA